MQKAICLNHISVKNQSFQNQLLKLHHHKHMVKTTNKNMQARSIYISISYSRKKVYIIIERVSAAITTGDHEFAVCPRHTAKTRRRTAKTSLTVADGKAPTAATGSAKTVFVMCQ